MSTPGTVASSLEEGAAFASPFAAAALVGREEETYGSPGAAAGPLTTPFAESLATLAEDELEQEAFAALAAEFEDDEFTEALEVLVHEAAGRHLRSSVVWSHEDEAASLAAADVEQWLEAIAANADHRLAQLEEHFGDRPVDSVTEAELDAFLGMELELSLPDGPIDAQEFFFKKLWKKAKKVVRGAVKIAKKGIKAVTKLLPLGRIFAVLRRLVRPLLKRVLGRAIGKLPAPLRPAARRLAGKLLGGSRRARRREAEFEADEIPDVADLAAEFDEVMAGAILAPDDASMEALLGEFEAAEPVDRGHSVHELAVARQRLARQLVEAEPGRPPIAEMEQFIPAVMAAMPLIRLGVRALGRERIVKKLAGLLASLTKDMVGPQIARPLSRHIADAGLRLLGLEAEGTEDGMLAAEALVAAAEDTVRDVVAMPAASLEEDLLVEAAVEEAFEAAATRHFPSSVLRPDLDPSDDEAARGIWVSMPRAARPHYRYRKYSQVRPVQITRPQAAAVTFAEGDTLEERLLDEDVTEWPVMAEIYHYELLPGGELGHLAAFELDGESYSDGAMEFHELEDEALLPAAPRQGRRTGRGGHRAGRRVVRMRVKGRRLRRRPRFAMGLDLTSSSPQLRLHLLVSERLSHVMAGYLERRAHAKVVAAVGRLVGEPRRRAMAARATRLLRSRGVELPDGGGTALATGLAERVQRVVAARLPEAGATLAGAARDPASGVTLTFVFPFADRDALRRGELGEPSLTIRPGMHRD